MANVRPYRGFVEEFGSLSKEAFLERVTEPHLYFTDGCDLFTALFKTVSSSETPVGPLPHTFSPARMKKQGIICLRKDPGSNAFGMMVTLGRAPNNDVVVAQARVSKFHAYFRKIGTRWTFTDARSTNGTTVDDVALPPERTFNLHSGAVIELANVVRTMFLEPEALWDLISYTRHALAASG